MSPLPLLAVLLLPGAPPAGKGEPRVFDAFQLEDQEKLARVLREHVAELEVEVPRRPDAPLEDDRRDGYGVVLEPRRLAVLSFIVEDALRVSVRGPTGRALEGKVVLFDQERRVAIVETARPVSEVGLVPAAISPIEGRQVDLVVFALTNTGPEATVVQGVITHVGDEPEYEGHHRVDLELNLGMPVFDDRARFVGYARQVAWDRDKRMLITPEQIRAARTATGAKDRAGARGSQATRPWWGR